eukprot:730683-Prorocentrum_minimum.AAC.1
MCIRDRLLNDPCDSTRGLAIAGYGPYRGAGEEGRVPQVEMVLQAALVVAHRRRLHRGAPPALRVVPLRGGAPHPAPPLRPQSTPHGSDPLP